eukprot:jgi/Tetstr1/463868/TSEL_008679.t1
MPRSLCSSHTKETRQMTERKGKGSAEDATPGRTEKPGKAGDDTSRGWMNPVGPDPELYPDPSPEPEDPPASGTPPVASEPANVGSGTANVGSGTANVGSDSADVGSGTAKPPKQN